MTRVCPHFHSVCVCVQNAMNDNDSNDSIKDAHLTHSSHTSFCASVFSKVIQRVYRRFSYTCVCMLLLCFAYYYIYARARLFALHRQYCTEYECVIMCDARKAGRYFGPTTKYKPHTRWPPRCGGGKLYD